MPMSRSCEIQQTTLIVHPSQFEGKSIALDEAKLFCKPIVVTNFSTVADQFVDRFNASIVNMYPEALANGIIELIDHTELQAHYISNLNNEKKDNCIEIEKLYQIFDS